MGDTNAKLAANNRTFCSIVVSASDMKPHIKKQGCNIWNLHWGKLINNQKLIETKFEVFTSYIYHCMIYLTNIAIKPD